MCIVIINFNQLEVDTYFINNKFFKKLIKIKRMWSYVVGFDFNYTTLLLNLDLVIKIGQSNLSLWYIVVIVMMPKFNLDYI